MVWMIHLVNAHIKKDNDAGTKTISGEFVYSDPTAGVAGDARRKENSDNIQYTYDGGKTLDEALAELETLARAKLDLAPLP